MSSVADAGTPTTIGGLGRWFVCELWGVLLVIVHHDVVYIMVCMFVCVGKSDGQAGDILGNNALARFDGETVCCLLLLLIRFASAVYVVRLSVRAMFIFLIYGRVARAW